MSCPQCRQSFLIAHTWSDDAKCWMTARCSECGWVDTRVLPELAPRHPLRPRGLRDAEARARPSRIASDFTGVPGAAP